ncbi:pimeloyl-ACP methyl ester carboxylesterase [Saccharomonospora amisosensis]|uniref:Pimeloyl-ACP methyl ester carboxylesterase n=1 Tax=Saccharomonospora amisosensis TaxID=1128677 RepID=A0A7X5ZRA6_9PSEU|nr:alpha/beta hydrolase [Saccharomonospora amisosensis]NIJ12684.1 pimeloyl-ACP methyl ester carboxylesterase [Saccharomonospora amisosensis]
MTSVMPQLAAVVLPGTGSDEVFVRSVFARPLAALGIELIAPPPPRGADVVAGSGRLLDEIAGTVEGPLLVGGISLGAHLATEWALRRQDRCAGVLVALPAWNGAADAAPAAVAASVSADLVAREGVAAALEVATAGVAPWLAAELTRAWRRHGKELAASLRAASVHRAPELARLPELKVPVGIAACTDDPVHPVAVAHAWAQALPKAVLRETTLAAVGADRQVLGRAAVRAWLRARRA